MTCEDIIQRLLDDRHITVKEAMIMIKALVKNTIPAVTPGWPNTSKDFWNPSDIAVMYGVQTMPKVTCKEQENNGLTISNDYPTFTTNSTNYD